MKVGAMGAAERAGQPRLARQLLEPGTKASQQLLAQLERLDDRLPTDGLVDRDGQRRSAHLALVRGDASSGRSAAPTLDQCQSDYEVDEAEAPVEQRHRDGRQHQRQHRGRRPRHRPRQRLLDDVEVGADPADWIGGRDAHEERHRKVVQMAEGAQSQVAGDAGGQPGRAAGRHCGAEPLNERQRDEAEDADRDRQREIRSGRRDPGRDPTRRVDGLLDVDLPDQRLADRENGRKDDREREWR
jgi:hypothetical protein